MPSNQAESAEPKQEMELQPLNPVNDEEPEEIRGSAKFYEDHFVPKMFFLNMLVPLCDCGMDVYQAAFWFLKGEFFIGSICLAFTVVPAAIASVLVFANFKEETENKKYLLKTAGTLTDI